MFGRLGRWSKVSIALLALAFACLFVSWIFLTIDSVRQARKGDELLRALANLRLGTSTIQDANSIVSNFGGVRVRHAQTADGAEPDCDVEEIYGIAIAPHWIDEVRLKVPLAIRLGLVRDWTLDGAIHLKNGAIACVTYTVMLARSGPFVILSGSLRPHSSWNEGESYSVGLDPHPRGHRLALRIYPEATAEEHATVFHPDLHCLNSFWGCSYPCELSPAAWNDYLKTPAWQHLVLGYGKPNDADDPRCRPAPANS